MTHETALVPRPVTGRGSRRRILSTDHEMIQFRKNHPYCYRRALVTKPYDGKMTAISTRSAKCTLESRLPDSSAAGADECPWDSLLTR
jgi:hypothetical protein